jgi:putative transposase
MSRKRYTPEQIIGKLREAEVALAQGQKVAQVCHSLGIAEQTFYRWRREYGGLKVEQAKRLKFLEQENTGLTAAIIGYAAQFGRYGYRRITALLHRDGWIVNHKRVEQIWRQEGLKVPQKQPKMQY